MVDPRGLPTRATVVKCISVCLLDLITDSQDLTVITGDIENAFIQAESKENIFTKCGAEFGDCKGYIARIICACMV